MPPKYDHRIEPEKYNTELKSNTMDAPLRTKYEFAVINPSIPRCRNSHTLVPMFVQRDASGELITDPVAIETIPAKFFWRNSMGWGFDVRNLSVLLRVNFRNVNPHTIELLSGGEVVYEPLWCNAIDLGSLVHHPELDPRVNRVIAHRTKLLNMLSDNTKIMLANAARELYSADYQGFYDWVANQPQFDPLMRAMGYRVTQRGTLHEIETIQRKRRKTAFAGIVNSTNAQSGEHFCEPSGIDRQSDLYRVLEHYKAGVARDLVEYFEDLAERRRRFCGRLEDRVLAYRAIRFTAITRRYAREVLRAMVDLSRKGRALRLVTRPRIVLWRMEFRDEGVDGDTTITVSLVGSKCEVRINSMAVDADSPDDVFPLLESIIPQIIHPSKRLAVASLAGGMVELLPKTAKWRKTIRSDNRFLQAAATEWLAGTTYVRWVDRMLVEPGGPLWTAIPHVRIRQMQSKMPRAFSEHMYMDVARNMALHAPEIFEFELINQRQLKAGYDGFEGSLLDKLRAALDYRTCVQDVGGDMCEMLSVPYPPEDEEVFAQFQCDHTNIPPPIAPRVPLNMMPITNLRLPQDIFDGGDSHPPPPAVTVRRHRRRLPRRPSMHIAVSMGGPPPPPQEPLPPIPTEPSPEPLPPTPPPRRQFRGGPPPPRVEVFEGFNSDDDDELSA